MVVEARHGSLRRGKWSMSVTFGAARVAIRRA
jgi:hypothetical protein